MDQLGAGDSALSETLAWVRAFRAKPHLDLGLPGPVCPFIPLELRQDTIWLTVHRRRDPGERQVEHFVQQYRDVFLALEPREGEAALFKTILIVFPTVEVADAPRLIDGVQRRLKPHFIDGGLMIGEFHVVNEAPGLHNPEFRPLRSPIPMLAVRTLVEPDLPFLGRELDPPAVRVHYLTAYLRHMATMQPGVRLDVAREGLARAEAELAQLKVAG